MSASNESRKNFSLLQILGWLTGALSSLNLIEELSAVKIYGNLKKWLDAYTGFVEKIGSFLFGWIDFGWIQVSDLEMHILVLSAVLIAAYCRAQFRLFRLQGENPVFALLGSCFGLILFFCPMIIAALLLPTWLGLLGTVVFLSLACFAFFRDTPTAARFPSKKEIVDELIGVTAAFFFLIALNYTVFKSWS